MRGEPVSALVSRVDDQQGPPNTDNGRRAGSSITLRKRFSKVGGDPGTRLGPECVGCSPASSAVESAGYRVFSDGTSKIGVSKWNGLVAGVFRLHHIEPTIGV